MDTSIISSGGRTYLPEEWGDSERMRVLMGPLPTPQLNQVAHDARLTFWAAAIHSWCRAELKPAFNVAECQAAFRRGSQIPVCLPEVLQIMMRQGDVIPVDQFTFTDPKQETWTGWGQRVFLVRPTQAFWGHIKYFIGLGGLGNTVLVCRAVLQEMCDRLMDTVWAADTPSPLLFTLKALHSLSRELIGPLPNLELAVKALVAQGKAVTVLHHGIVYVKFGNPGAVERPMVTAEDLARNDLNEAKERVEQSLKALEEERHTLRCQAKEALSRGSKTEALSLLRRRKRVDKSVVTQLGVLENLTSWLYHMDDAQTNRQVLGAFKGGVEALRKALAGDASPDNAANTLDDLQQVLEECEDLNSLISTNPVADDMTDLEEELEDLMLGDKQMDVGMDPPLPDVPTHSPLPTTTTTTAAAATEPIPRLSP